jgi:hypothetical protein
MKYTVCELINIIEKNGISKRMYLFGYRDKNPRGTNARKKVRILYGKKDNKSILPE